MRLNTCVLRIRCIFEGLYNYVRLRLISNVVNLIGSLEGGALLLKVHLVSDCSVIMTVVNHTSIVSILSYLIKMIKKGQHINTP